MIESFLSVNQVTLKTCLVHPTRSMTSPCFSTWDSNFRFALRKILYKQCAICLQKLSLFQGVLSEVWGTLTSTDFHLPFW